MLSLGILLCQLESFGALFESEAVDMEDRLLAINTELNRSPSRDNLEQLVNFLKNPDFSTPEIARRSEILDLAKFFVPPKKNSPQEMPTVSSPSSSRTPIPLGDDVGPPSAKYARRNPVVFPRTARAVTSSPVDGDVKPDENDHSSALQAIQTILRNQLILPEGLQYEPVPGDGHCLYYAVGLYLGKSQKDLRTEVADYIETHEDEAEFSGIMNALLPQGSSMADYVHDIRTGLEWADNLEIVILSRIYNRPIIVIDPNGDIRNRDALEVAGEPIFVYYNGHNHYDGLVKTANRSGMQILAEMNINSIEPGDISLRKKDVSDASIPPTLLPDFNSRKQEPSLKDQATLEEELLKFQVAERARFAS